MATELIEKPLTEAQRIIARLESEFAMAPAAIANEIKLKAHIVNNIKTRHTTGNLQLPRLRRLLSVMEQGPTQSASSNTANILSFEDIVPNVVPDATIDPRDDPAAIALNAEEPAPADPKSLKDKAGDWLRAAMLGEPSQVSSQSGMSAPSRSKKNSGGAEQGDLIEQLVPLAALLFVMSGSVLLPDPYKPCGPNHAEASAIAYPIVKRAVRELDARKKLSEATTDAIAILLAVSAYGVRAHGTWQAIHAEEVQRERSSNRPTGAEFVQASGGGPSNATATPDHASARPDGKDGAKPLPFWRGDARATREAVSPAGSGENRRPVTPEQRRADASIDALLAMDHAGRQRLGL